MKRLDQRDAMPSVLWAWSEHGPEPARDGMALAQDAFHFATKDAARAAAYISQEFKNDSEVFAYGVLHVMALYAERVDVEFQQFMKKLFKNTFKDAPVKKTERMMTKLRQDLEEDFEDGEDLATAWDEPESAAASALLRSFPYGLGDLVRGSVTVDGADAMVAVADQLRADTQDGAGRRFEAWRIKNTHHRDAVVVGGYRDVKVLGKFSADLGEETVAMIVEIQVIDATFLSVKTHMHKPFTIARGDFW